MRKIIRITTVPQSMKTLLKGQLRFMSQYYDIVAVSSDGDCFEDMLREQGVRGVKIPMTRKITPLADLKALFLLIRLFIKEKPDAVHTHTPKAGTLGMIAAWITRVPVRMHTVAGLPLLVATGRKRLLLDIVEKVTYACATTIYPNSYKMRDIIQKLGFTSDDKLKVIANGSSNGIDLTYFDRTEAVVKQATTYREEGCFTFCFVGRMVRDKGINELVSAFVRLHKQYPQIHLLLVGPFEKELDPLSPETEKAIQEHSAIHFVGFQSDVRPFLAASDALVFPSYREGFPNVVLQAGAMGLPSIVTDINGCNEIIIPNENGVIIPSKDEEALYRAMENFLLHPEEVRRMTENARPLIASRYDQKIVWEALLKEYKRIIGK